MKESFFQLKEQSIDKIEFIKNENCSVKKLKLKFNHNINIIKNENQAKVILDFFVFDKELTEEMPFYINIKISGMFTWQEIPDSKLLDSLLKENAPAILLSFIRSMISQITAYSGYPTLIIPLLNFKEQL